MLLSQTSRDTWLLNQERGSWARCAHPPLDEDFHFTAAAAAGDEIIGYAHSPGSKSFVAFKPKLNAWRLLPWPRNMDSCYRLASLDGDKVVAGGHVSSQLALYDGKMWTPIPAHPGGVLTEYTVGAVGRRVFVGSGVKFGTKICANNLYSYDIAMGVWTETANFTMGPSVACAVVAGRLYSVGFPPYAIRLGIYDPQTDLHIAVDVGTSLPSWFHDLAYSVCTFNNKLVLLPGGRPDVGHRFYLDPDPRPAILWKVDEQDVVSGERAAQWNETLLPSLASMCPDGPGRLRVTGVAVNPPC